MYYIRYKSSRENIAVMTLTLIRLGYELKNVYNYVKYLKGGGDITMLICTDLQTCYFCSTLCEVKDFTYGSKVISYCAGSNLETEKLLAILGINRTLEEQVEYILQSIRTGSIDCVDISLSNMNPDKDTREYKTAVAITDLDNIEINDFDKDTFHKSLIPGYIVELLVENEKMFGFILASETIVYVNCSGQIKGYLNKYTMDWPHKILSIRIPDLTNFQLKNYANMDIVWQRLEEVTKITKSISDIEKELGLKPDTLQII